MTNADKLRSMSTAEIADLLSDVERHLQCNFCIYKSNSDCSNVDESCREAIFMWLNEEYKNGQDQ
jgi:hypothetical protein